MTETNAHTKSPNLSITLDVDGELSWGELFWFVDQARKSGVDTGSAVPYKYDQHGEFLGFECFVFPSEVSQP
ncbi:hypothetical protein [Nocardioides okcheonensis]|uniref:hypothetical protein n=1 Tax=Nocardioides okcheonensis TaxID=2894081 RepID=UPI001E540E17|nr:hypothetical protein [Nocardioides okcheonensis]UFN44508.1 hypothetical protein LN652_21105 [Nocardioides okcheonensis]